MAIEGAFDKYCIMHIDVEIELKIDQFCVLRFASYVGAWQRGRGSRASCNQWEVTARAREEVLTSELVRERVMAPPYLDLINVFWDTPVPSRASGHGLTCLNKN